MTDIKPDTSLYTDLPSRLRAMALVLEGPEKRLQYQAPGGWSEPVSKWGNPDRVAGVARESHDYRLKPEPPARLYVDITDDGRVERSYPRADDCAYPPPMPGTTRVTYVLENPDANG